MSQNQSADNGQRSASAQAPAPAAPSQLQPGPKRATQTLPSKSSDDVTSGSSKLSKDRNASAQTSVQPSLSSTSPTRATSHGSTPAPGEQNPAGPSVINKQLLSKLNKSLKEKQKIINQKDPHTKNPTLMHDVLATSPQQQTHKPSNSLHGTEHSAGQQSDSAENDQSHGENAIPLPPAPSQSKDQEGKSKLKGKKIAKQNSSRTDFFAAKLASAVDDVDSSDSDETFVYETNPAESSTAMANTRASASAPSVVPEEGRANGPQVPTADNINQAPASIQLVNDNISIADGVKNPLESIINSPYEMKTEGDQPLNSYFPNSRAESVHSLQSSKYNLRNTFTTTPPSTTNGRTQVSLSNAIPQDHNLYANPFSEAHVKHNKNATRKSSLHSVLSEDRKEQSSRASQLGLGNTHPLTPVTASFGLNSRTQSISEPFNDVIYSYDQDVSDDASSHEDFNSIRTDQGAPPNASGQAAKTNEFFSNGRPPHNAKSSTTSSKLRSTTSKLFDKRGAQPRRYSTIPDDIDIEDFDDELIYYDNQNMRFPYNSNQNSVMNESSSLLGGHKLPHHRSLTLNFSAKRNVSHGKNKRYSSLGFVPPSSQLEGKKSDLFPFPYPENQHGYYDLDEYDEEALDQAERMHANHLKSPKSHMSPGFNKSMLSRKASMDVLDNGKMRIFRNMVYALIGVLCFLSIGFISGFLLASTKDLSNVSITSIENALVSQDELVFSVVVEALNPGWFTVSVEDLEIDIFAKSGYLEEDSIESVETVLLGTVLSFEFPLEFEGSFFSRKLLQETGEIKLVGPGRNFTGTDLGRQLTPIGDDDPKDPHQSPPDNAEKWAVISKHPFDLILRGVIKYKSPMTSNTKSVVVNKIGYIDPSMSNY